jgi:hypothetical protein
MRLVRRRCGAVARDGHHSIPSVSHHDRPLVLGMPAEEWISLQMMSDPPVPDPSPDPTRPPVPPEMPPEPEPIDMPSPLPDNVPPPNEPGGVLPTKPLELPVIPPHGNGPAIVHGSLLFWALLASGQVTMRKVDGWKTLTQASFAPAGP